METEPGDTPEAGAVESTARRELREEVGVEVRDVRVVTSGVFELDTGEPCLNVVCLAPHAAGEARPAAPEEVAAVEWRPVDRITGDDVPEFTRTDVEPAEAARSARA